MKFLRHHTATPNRLIDDSTMHYTSKVVYQVMAFSQRKNGLVKLTVAQLVALSGLCEETVLQALRELEAGGFIHKKRCWRWSKTWSCPVYASNTYKLPMGSSNGYTLISSEIMNLDITPADFCVLLFLYRCAGRTGRAFPSIRYIAGYWMEKTGRGLCMAKSTVLRALKRLEKLQAFVKRACEAKDGGLSCNSYYMTAMVLKRSCAGGGFIFRDASFNNKITKDLTRGNTDEGYIYGVGQFGNLHSFTMDSGRECPYWFDGTGVRVSAGDEQEITA